MKTNYNDYYYCAIRKYKPNTDDFMFRVLYIIVYKVHGFFFGGLWENPYFCKFSGNSHKIEFQWPGYESYYYVDNNGACSLRILFHTTHKYSPDLQDHLWCCHWYLQMCQAQRVGILSMEWINRVVIIW